MSVRFETMGLPWPEISGKDAIELTSFLHFVDYLGQPGQAAAGEGLFQTKGCARCHSIDGVGEASGLDLGNMKVFASPLYVSQAIWNHGPSMLESIRDMRMTPPQFEENDLANLSAYIRQTAEPGPQERMILSPGNPNNGQKVFQAKGCSSCHLLGGLGGGSGPDLTESDLHRSAESIAGIMWNHAVEMRASMREKGIEWPNFTATELADLIAFLYFLSFADKPGDPEMGREVFAQQSCGECHSDDASSHPGPDLLSSETVSSPALLVAAMWNHAPVMKEAIVSEGRRWPELTGNDLRDLLAYLKREASR
jgi:mono/diheme cytochrome c family protein